MYFNRIAIVDFFIAAVEQFAVVVYKYLVVDVSVDEALIGAGRLFNHTVLRGAKGDSDRRILTVCDALMRVLFLSNES